MAPPLKEFCKYGHPRTPENVDQRWGNCKTCTKTRQRAYRAKNKEKLAEYHREYKANNKEKIAEYHREYKANNKEKIAEYHRDYASKNKAKLRKYNMEYVSKNRDSLNEKKYVESDKSCDRLVTRSGKVISGPTAFELALYGG